MKSALYSTRKLYILVRTLWASSVGKSDEIEVICECGMSDDKANRLAAFGGMLNMHKSNLANFRVKGSVVLRRIRVHHRSKGQRSTQRLFEDRASQERTRIKSAVLHNRSSDQGAQVQHPLNAADKMDTTSTRICV